MINRVIEFSAKNKFIIFFVTAAAALAGWWSSHHVPLDAIRDLGRGDDRHHGRQQRLRWHEA